MFTIIAAIDKNRGIGYDKKIPWKLKSDLKFFKEVTLNNIIIMGRKTFESIPNAPLKNRVNIIITSKNMDNAICVKNFEEALQVAYLYNKKIFIIGGGEVYKTAIIHNDCNELLLSKIDGEFNCNVFFPEYNHFKKIEKIKEGEENGIFYECFKYKKTSMYFIFKFQLLKKLWSIYIMEEFIEEFGDFKIGSKIKIKPEFSKLDLIGGNLFYPLVDNEVIRYLKNNKNCFTIETIIEFEDSAIITVKEIKSILSPVQIQIIKTKFIINCKKIKKQ